MFRASNGFYVQFIASGMGSTDWQAETATGPRKRVYRYYDEAAFNSYARGSNLTGWNELHVQCPEKDGLDQARIDAVQEYLDHQQKEFELWLKKNPEMRKYA